MSSPGNLTTTLRSLHGKKVAAAIEELHRVENDLAGALLGVSDRHKVDHEVFHVARDIARWSQEHVRRLSEAGVTYGLDLDPEPQDEATLLARLKQRGSELTGRFHEPGLLLLADLRHLYREAAGTSVDWELLAQGAQGAKERELLDLAERCHPQTLRIARWANSYLKVTSPQVLAS